MEKSLVEKSLVIAEIRASAAHVVSIARDRFGQELGFDEEAVRWLDGFIQRQHEAGDPKNNHGLVNTLGSFLGECIIHSIGGEWDCVRFVEVGLKERIAQSFGSEWDLVDGLVCVRFDERNAAFPFTKVAKHLENGSEAGDSVLGFFTGTAELIPFWKGSNRG